MLIGIPPILGPDLLHALRAMGHGDEIALVDGNYPAAEHARRLVRADGVDLVTLLSAVLQILPVESAFRAAQDNDPLQASDVHHRIDATLLNSPLGKPATPLAGADLYTRVKSAFAVVASSEQMPFANVILRKGVITAPDTV